MRNIFCISMILSAFISIAQNKVDLLNKGNEFYINEEFENAEIYYKKSLVKDSLYYKAILNTGHALFKQSINLIGDSLGYKKLIEAEMFYNNSLKLSKSDEKKAESYYNLGNSQLLNQKIEESNESYKSSLRLVPDNINAKHNLALAQFLLKKQQNNNQEQQNQEKEEEEKEKEEKEKKKENNQSEQKEKLSQEEIDQILKALEREETEVQEDLQKKKVSGEDDLLKDW